MQAHPDHYSKDQKDDMATAIAAMLGDSNPPAADAPSAADVKLWNQQVMHDQVVADNTAKLLKIQNEAVSELKHYYGGSTSIQDDPSVVNLAMANIRSAKTPQAVLDQVNWFLAKSGKAGSTKAKAILQDVSQTINANPILPVPKVDKPKGSGVDNNDQNGLPPGVIVTPDKPSAPMFKLLQDQATGATYVVNNRGELFHVSETLMNEMKAGGSWVDPTPTNMSGMPIRYTVDSIQDLSTINNATVGNNLMLIKGGAPGNPDDTVLIGNGNAVYAVDNEGHQFHVTGNAFNQLTNQNGGQPPVIGTITQNAVDSHPVDGSLEDNNGTVEVETDDPQDIAVQKAKALLGGASAPNNPSDPNQPSSLPPAAVNNIPPPSHDDPVTGPATQPPPTDETLAVSMSAQDTSAFNFVRGDDGAIYAVNAGNQKFHITPELWGQLTPDQQNFQQMSSADINQNFKDGSTIPLTNIDQLRSININAGSEFRLVKGINGDMNKADTDLVDNGKAVYALTSTGDRYHVTAELANKMGGAFGNIESIDQHQLDNMGAMKGELKTVADLNKAVKTSAASGFDGDTSALPGGVTAIAGYAPQK